MKYEKHILDAFSRLGFTPRGGQVEAINKILTAYLDNGAQNVILSAPTGTGKSLIGAVTSETLTAILNPSVPNCVKSSIGLVSTNVLAKQYDATFSSLQSSKKYIMLKGASNYKCSALSTHEAEESAESCAWYDMVKSGNEFSGIIAEHCNSCEYLNIKKLKNAVKHLTTNYSYFFIDRMYTGKFEDRDLLVWDEAHLINDLFSEHNAIYFSQTRLQAAAKEIADLVRLTDLEIAKLLSSVAKDCAKKGKITEQNYESYLRALLKIYSYAKTTGQAQAERALRSGQMGQYTKLCRFVKKYEGLICKIDDYFNYGYDHIFEYKEDEAAVSVKPIFIGNMFDALQASPRNLFMSATISREFMIKTLKLNPNKTEFIKLPPTFSPENKSVIFFNPLSLNFTSLQNPTTVDTLCKNICKIVKKHSADGERGIILSPSFKLQSSIMTELKRLDKTVKIFEHIQGKKLEEVLTLFKSYTGGPAVLVSPAMFEGIDLPGDLSRYQVFVKAPFPSLGDKRMKYILDNYPELYEEITIMKIVQGAGRSVRSIDDHATTYILDKNAQRLLSSSKNVWKDEFYMSIKSIL